MRILRDLPSFPPELRPSVAAFGAFDGIHLAHAKILDTAVERARALGVSAVACTFDPHPTAVLRPEKAPAPIATLEENLARIAERGLDAFDTAFGEHVSFAFSNACGAFFHNITGAMLAPAPDKSFDTAHWYRELARSSRSFAFVADVTVASLGGSLKMKQKLSGRLADALAELAVAAPAAVARRHEVAEPAQAVKRLRLRAEPGADAHHFHQRARQERGFRVVAEFQPVAAARRDRVDVFQAAAELHAREIVAGVDA